MYNLEISKVARLIAAMAEVDIHNVMEINIVPGALTVRFKRNFDYPHDSTGKVFQTIEIPWDYEVPQAKVLPVAD